jgi:TetR/AcrR family transcriptional regulator of autoinduction and epiphytic fitness
MKKAGAGRRAPAGKAEAILEGAMREFLAHGYAATSMDRVASAAGVSKATVYSHFRDKEALFNSLVEHLAGERFRRIFGALRAEHRASAAGPPGRPPGAPPAAVTLRRLALSLLEIARTDEHLVAFMRLIVGESGRFPELARAYVNHLAKPVIENLAGYLKSRPELKLRDPEAAARVFTGTLVYYIIVQQVLHGKRLLPMKRERLVDGLVNLITEDN